LAITRRSRILEDLTLISAVVGNSNLTDKIEFYKNRTAETKHHGNVLNVWEKNRQDEHH